jgi:parallel beta-helix repeat protein
MHTKPIYYYVNQRGLVVDSQILQNIGYLGLVNSTNITIRNLNMTSKWQGVLLAFTTNSTLENIYASKNEYGIYLILSTTT